MQKRAEETLEDFVDRLGADDQITPQAAGEILSFNRFLQAVCTWKRVEQKPSKGVNWIRTREGEPYTLVPDEWVPYVAGTGPAPDTPPTGGAR